jgi:hypothetical protein
MEIIWNPMMIITESQLEKSINSVLNMTQSEQESLFDEIMMAQPTLFQNILIQKQYGNPLYHIGILLQLLLILMKVVNDTKIEIEMISEDEFERHMKRIAAIANFSESLSSEEKLACIEQHLSRYQNTIILSYVFDEIVSKGLCSLANESSKFLPLVGLAMTTCILEAIER